MQEIQLIMVKVIKLALVASLVPPLVLLIIAAYNERLRRILLRILAPLAALAIIAYLILAPRKLASIEDWRQAGEALKSAFLAGLPFIIGLIIIGFAAYLFGPAIREAIESRLHRRARRAYLEKLLNWVEPQLAGIVELEGRSPVDLAIGEVKTHLRITGEPGSGKTTLLRSLLREAARQALSDDHRPLPVWIDLDEQLAAPEGLLLDQLDALLPFRTRFLNRMLQREGLKHQLIFFIDSSVQSFAMTFAASGDANAHTAQDVANHLAKLIEAYQPCPFILAMPPEVESGTLNHLVDNELFLEPLSEAGINAGIQMLAREHASKLADALAADDGIWRELASRPAFLYRLGRFYRKQKRLPVDVRELFRTAVYPAKAPVEQVEAALMRLSEQVMVSGQYWQAVKAPGDFEALGMVRKISGNASGGQPAAQVSFAHPIFLAYATALAWHANQETALGAVQTAAHSAERKSHQPDSLWSGSGQVEISHGDPVLADALIFFNNIEADPQRLAGTLSVLIEQNNRQDASGTFRLFLATQCLLALPPAKRPPALVTQVSVQLIEEMAYDQKAAAQARLLMEPLNEETRLDVYAQALTRMDETRLEQTLRRIVEPESAGSQNHLDLLHTMLWRGSETLSRMVGEVWAECEPREALILFKDLYENGPAGLRLEAIQLLGRLPHKEGQGAAHGAAPGAALKVGGEYLHGLLQTEKDPALRVAILRSLQSSGAETVSRLLEIVADRQEADEVRNYAAELLAYSEDPEIRTAGVVREIVRVSRIPMPERAQNLLQRLLETLRGAVPEQTTRWEEVVNPYIVGRPVTNPQQFFGREALLRDLYLAIDNLTPVLLTGERGSGKTSLLYRLAAALKEEASQGIPVRVVLLDLEGLQPHEFYETAIRAIIEGLQDPALSADPNVPRPYSDQHFSQDLEELLSHIQAAPGPHGHLALLLDGGDIFTGYPPAMHASLRRVLNGAIRHGLVPILAAADPLQHWQPEEPPFYSTYLHLTVPRLSREEALRLIVEPVAGTFQYQPEALECILQAAQGRPDAIQMLCQKVIRILLAQGDRVITGEQVAEALQDAGPRAALLAHAENTLGGMMDWLEAHPEATNAQLEEQMKRAWGELQKAIVQQVVRARKGKT